jgi:hypothetical protein
VEFASFWGDDAWEKGGWDCSVTMCLNAEEWQCERVTRVAEAMMHRACMFGATAEASKVEVETAGRRQWRCQCVGRKWCSWGESESAASAVVAAAAVGVCVLCALTRLEVENFLGHHANPVLCLWRWQPRTRLE